MSGSYRLTILLAIVLLGISSYVYFIDVPASEQIARTQRAESKLIPFDDRLVTRLTLETADEHIVFDRDQRGRWLITTPLTAPADAREVRKILRALTLGKVERIIQEQPTDLEQYGLHPQHMTVTVTDGKETITLLLGNPGPFSSSLYVRKGSDGPVVLTTLNVLTFAKKNLFTFRLKDVLFFNHAKVVSLKLQSPAQNIELYRVPGVHGMSPDWRFREPTDGPADKTNVGILLMALEDLKAQAFIDSEGEKIALLTQLGEPTATATIQTGRNTHLVSFYQDRDTTYAQTTAEKPLYRISPQIVREVTQGLFALRDKRLLGLTPDEVAILQIKTATDSYTLIHQNKEWILKDDPTLPIKQKTVKLFISRLADLPAEHRITVSEAELSRYGLDPPSLAIRGIDKQGRERGRLMIGTSDHGLVYATGAGLPGIFQARSTILTQVPTRQELIKTPAP